MHRVLIIDDSATIRSLLKLYLGGLDLSVQEADDGQEGLDAVRRDCVDLVVIDLRMPVMDGLEFIRRVRAEKCHARLPIILLTLDSTPQTHEEALRTGANVFLTKPVCHATLRETVQRLLGVHGMTPAFA